MKVVLDSTRVIPAGQYYTLTEYDGGQHSMIGSGTVRTIMTEFGERRVAQVVPTWLAQNYRRRKDDVERRREYPAEFHWNESDRLRIPNSRRRKGDERRNKLTTEFRYGGRRVYDREERRAHRQNYTYVKSLDPRIRALERRKVSMSLYTYAMGMDAGEKS